MDQDADTIHYAPNSQQVIDRAGWATTAMVLGIVGLVMAFVPIIGMVAFVLCPLAIIFGVLARKSSKGGQATTGLVCGIVGLCISIAWAVLFTAAVSSTSKSLDAYNTCVHNIAYTDTNYSAEFNHCLSLMN